MLHILINPFGGKSNNPLGVTYFPWPPVAFAVNNFDPRFTPVINVHACAMIKRDAQLGAAVLSTGMLPSIK